MKKLIIVLVLVINLMFFGNTVSAEMIYDKVICKTDSFTNKTSCTYNTQNIKDFAGAEVGSYSLNSRYLLMLINQPENWELLRQSRIILFKIDGVLHKKKYKLDTRIGNGYVLEFVQILLSKDFISLIASSKECKIRVGCCKETFINQKFKDGIKELLTK